MFSQREKKKKKNNLTLQKLSVAGELEGKLRKTPFHVLYDVYSAARCQGGEGGDRLGQKQHAQRDGTNGVLLRALHPEPRGKPCPGEDTTAPGSPFLPVLSSGPSRRLQREGHSGCVMKGLLQLISPRRGLLRGRRGPLHRLCWLALSAWPRDSCRAHATLAKESFPLPLPSQESTRQRATEVTRSACYCVLQEGRYVAFRSVYQLTSL